MSAAGFLEKLLGGSEVAWVPLGDDYFFEIANTARRPVKASLRSSGSIPYYGANNIQDYVKGHTHINLTGDYLWRSSAKIGAGKFRPLRPLQPA